MLTIKGYRLYVLLEGVKILDQEPDYVPVFSKTYDSLEELRENERFASFLTDGDLDILKGDAEYGIRESWSRNDFGEVGGIWCRESDGLHYIYNSCAIEAQGVYALAIAFVFN